MMKKRVLLCALAAGLFITSILCLNACNKNSEGDVVPTEVTIMRGATEWHFCDHCDDTLWDRNWYCMNPQGPHWALDDWRVFHVHEYQINDDCALRHCRYNKRHHRHEVFYCVDTITGNDHYEDNWIHIGGGGGGE
jgi:hypothetical protein